jgi:nitrogenase subunit NifH
MPTMSNLRSTLRSRRLAVAFAATVALGGIAAAASADGNGESANAPSGPTATAAVLDLLGESGRRLLLPVQIGISQGLQRAQLLGRDVYDVEPECRGAKQYRELAGYLLPRLRTVEPVS